MPGISRGSGESVTRSDVNLFSMPEAEDNFDQPNGVVTLGDLHGNTLKFLYMLQREGVIEIDDEDDYENAKNLYYDSVNENVIDDFNDFLNTIEKNDKSNIGLREIGDDVADRGLNDILTFFTYKRLTELNVPYEVIGSNHGMEFLKQYAAGIAGPINMLYTGANQSYGNSLHGLRKYIEKGYITENAVNDLIQKYYVGNIKMLSYLIEDDKNITVYSHAPIHENSIKSLAQLMKVEFDGSDVNKLAETVDRINSAFHEIVIDKSKLNANNVHGHVGEFGLKESPNSNWTYSNLDSDTGKSPAFVRRDYPAFISSESAFAPRLALEKEAAPSNTVQSTTALLAEKGVVNLQEPATLPTAEVKTVPPAPQVETNKENILVNASKDDNDFNKMSSFNRRR